ncbi:MAG: PIG-L deacetylase family protein [Ilumatobacteraceae bacterium]
MGANEPGQPAHHDLTTTAWSRDLAVPSSALAIGAHPDDVEFGAGATLAKWAATGCVVHHLVCTDGSKGTWNPDADIAALVATRQAEQQRAAGLLSGSSFGTVTFLGRVDGDLVADRETVSEVAKVIRTVRPQVVLGHDPWRRYRLHPDHRAAGFLVCDAIVAARDPHFFREHGIAHHRPDALLLWEADEPDHVEDVGEHVDAKLAALAAHESQFESTMHAVADDGLEAFRQRIRARLAGLGEAHGLAAAEVFKLITDL